MPIKIENGRSTSPGSIEGRMAGALPYEASFRKKKNKQDCGAVNLLMISESYKY